MRRCAFLQMTPAGALAQAAPATPTAIRLGFDSYSIPAMHWKAARLIEYTFRKEDRVKEIVSSRGEHAGLECIFSAMEPCSTYKT
ncbi:MAG: hypothetical protein ABIZ80_04495, partial [Bryobacteraceae bacterium]